MTVEIKTAEQMADELRAQIKTDQEALQKTADAALQESKKAGELSAETKSAVDQALTALNTMREQLADIEQKMARKPGADGAEPKSYGEQFAESETFKAYKSRGFDGSSGRFEFDVKAITAAQSGTAWSERDNTVDPMPRRRMTVRNLLRVVQTTSGSVDYAQQTTRTNNAAVVAEGSTKASSAYVWSQVTATVRTIAHLAKITRQALDDAQQLQGEVESEMRYGLQYAEEVELLTGDGTGVHLSGLVTNATAFSAPVNPAGTETMIDNIRLALLQAELALYVPDGIILNPGDWALIELTKDSAGGYIFANPQQSASPRLWAQPVVSTPAMTVDKFLVGAFQMQTLYDRMAPEVLISSENSDDFEKNLYTMRCEERIALACRYPGALIYGDFGNV